MSNSAYADQRVYGGDIAGISNSPFTDERRQGGGGGTPGGDGTGNVQYETGDETLNIRVAEVNTIITSIDQGANEFVIGNDRGTLDFTQSGDVVLSHGFQDTGNLVIKAEATTTGNGNILIETETSNITGAGDINLTSKNSVRLTSDESTVINAKALSSLSEQGTVISSLNQDVEILAKEFSFVRGEKGVVIESGLLNGVYENSIDMEIDQQNSKIIIKSEGDSFENRILLQTVSNGTNAGGCNLVLVSDDIPANSDKVLLNVQSILQNQEWLNIKGVDTSNDEHSLVFTRDEVKFSAFEFFNFAGQDQLGVVPKNPVFQFSNIQTNKEEYYQFKSFPITPGQILEISGGLGGQTTPWELNWVTPATVSGGNVTSDGQSDILTRTVNGVVSQIEDITQTGNLTISSDSGENKLEMTQDSGSLNKSIVLSSSGASTIHSVSVNATTGSATAFMNCLSAVSNFVGDRAQIGAGNCYLTMSEVGSFGTNTASFNSCEVIDFCKFAPPAVIPVPKFVFRNGQYFIFNSATEGNGQYLRIIGGNGSISTPWQLGWASGGGGGGSLNSLDITYDNGSSTLVLSDPVDGVISQTSIVPGRTILINTVVVNGQGTFSVFGLSNTVFPPVASTILVGNNPPSVPLGSLGESLWSIGNTFRVSIGGQITDFDNNDNLIYQVVSNRGQTSQNVLNSFNLELSGVANAGFGFTWTVMFTVRTLNVGAVLGTVATNSSFVYTDDQFKPETEGAIVSNINASFDTSILQYLDLTLQFPSAGNSMRVTTAVIERIF